MLQEFYKTGDHFLFMQTHKHIQVPYCCNPQGGGCFVSDLFEGDINDVQIFKESGLVKHLKPFDLVLADCGFTVRELLNPLQVELNIPSFLKGRKSLSAAEELETSRITKARIHVEHFNE